MMALISVRIPDELLKEVDYLVEKGVFQSRAEAIRYALRIMLQQYKKVYIKEVMYNG